VRACSAIGATLIYISTDFVFDGRKKSPYKETDKTHALSVYGDSKLKGERFIEKVLKKNYFVLRTSWLYGKYGKNFADTIIAKAKREKSLKVVTDQVGSPTWTRDLARAIHKLLGIIRSQKSEVRSQKSIICRTQHATRNTRYGIYHITNSGRVSWHEYAEEILKLAKIKATVIPITSAELGRPARRPAMSVMDNSKFIKLTGYEMPSWKQALKNYLSKR
jgi:dTDP-4-dehydrorhamnose reductase